MIFLFFLDIFLKSVTIEKRLVQGNVNYIQRENEVELQFYDDFDLEKIFECGQCFRWNADGNGTYTGVAKGKVVQIRREDEKIFISGTVRDFEEIWYDYFDLGRNYSDIRKKLCIDDYMRKAAGFGAGIRILRQDRWETLCSFVLSQCNNIPRIKKLVEAMAENFGDPVDFMGRTYYTFPCAEKIAALETADLAPVKCGYRAPYILEAARAVSSGALSLEKLAAGEPEEARRILKQQNGIGDKVANCIILFSLRMMDAFPVDVWMKKAIKEHYGENFNPGIFGGYAGLAQQYMFYFQRSGRGKAAS